jgi:hypothetical protein
MKFEYPMFQRTQIALCHQAKIRHEFFVLHSPVVAMVLPIHLFEACVTDVLFPRCAMSKTRVAGPKYRPEHTIAGCFFIVPAPSTQSESLALRALFFG